jgi:hypothetical protein
MNPQSKSQFEESVVGSLAKSAVKIGGRLLENKIYQNFLAMP